MWSVAVKSFFVDALGGGARPFLFDGMEKLTNAFRNLRHLGSSARFSARGNFCHGAGVPWLVAFQDEVPVFPELTAADLPA